MPLGEQGNGHRGSILGHSDTGQDVLGFSLPARGTMAWRVKERGMLGLQAQAVLAVSHACRPRTTGFLVGPRAVPGAAQ